MARPHKIDQFADVEDLGCTDRVVHVDAVRTARAALPPREALYGLSQVFSALGDPTRLRIVAALASQELCVCDLAATVRQTESAISHQLRLLRKLGLVRSRREGRLVYYALDDAHVTTLYGQGLDHVRHQAECET